MSEPAFEPKVTVDDTPGEVTVELGVLGTGTDDNDSVKLGKTTKVTPELLENSIEETFQEMLKKYPKPKELEQDDDDHNPEERAGILSRIFFFFVHPLVALGYARALTQDDLPKLKKRHSSLVVAPLLQGHWERQCKLHAERQRELLKNLKPGEKLPPSQPSLIRAIVGSMGLPAALLLIAQVFLRVIQVMQPIVVEKILMWLAVPGEPELDGYLYALALSLMMFFHNMLNDHYFNFALQLFVQIRCGLCALIYTKALKVAVTEEDNTPATSTTSAATGNGDAPKDASNQGEQKSQEQPESQPQSQSGADGQHKPDAGGSSMGQIVNLMSVDSERLAESCYFAWGGFYLPAQLGVTLWLLYDTVGPSMFAGLGVLIVVLPFVTFALVQVGMAYEKRMGLADNRVKLTNEVLQGIRIVKFYAWEYFFRDRLNGIRQTELDAILHFNWLSGLVVAGFVLMASYLIVITLSVYSALHDDFSPTKVFKAVAFLNALQQPLYQIPDTLNAIVSGTIAAQRITKFLLLPELESVSGLSGAQPLLYHKRDYLIKKKQAEQEGRKIRRDAIASVKLEYPAIGHDRDLDAEAARLAEDPKPILDQAAFAKGQMPPKDEANAIELHKCTFTWRSVRLAIDTLASQDEPEDTTPQIDETVLSRHSVLAQPLMGEIPASLGDLSPEQRRRLDRLPIVLKNIDFTAMRGKITAIVGPVGSGKTSLLCGILGELDRIRGEVARNPDDLVAYVAQTAWIQSMSVRDNITFGLPLDAEEDRAHYEHTLDVCALRPDIAQFEAGDETEIGDRGINLSGGQKQRVAIARAVYSRADVYLFDDPLSAVDAHVAEHIFTECIEKALAGKTRVIVMNQLHLLPRCDYIYVLNATKLSDAKVVEPATAKDNSEDVVLGLDTHDETKTTPEGAIEKESTVTSKRVPMIGYIAECGTYAELNKSSVHFQQMLQSYRESLQKKEHEEEGQAKKKQANKSTEPAADAKEDDEEKKHTSSDDQAVLDPTTTNVGTIETKVSGKSSSGGNYVGGGKLKKGQQVQDEELSVGRVPWRLYWWYAKSMGLENVIPFVIFTLISEAALAWLGVLLGYWTENKWNKPVAWYRNLYLGLLAGATVAVFIRIRFFALGATKASSSYHGRMIDRVLRASSAFFDVTPSGRILNRFNKDLDSLDSMIPLMIVNMLAIGLGLLTSLVVCAAIYPWFTIALVIMLVLFVSLQTYYSPAAVQTQRLEQVSRSPVYQHFSESLRGIATIRAFGRTSQFQIDNARRIDTNNAALYWVRMVDRWGGIRISLIQNVLITVAVFLIVGTKGDFEVGMSGVVITYVLSFSSVIGFLVMMSIELAGRMSSIERLQHYIEHIPQEASLDDGIDGYKPPADWPSKGVVEYEGVKMRYRPELPPVLHNLSFRVEGSEKVGVVGRTGSGKSSLMMLLMRLYEIEKGRILIDGVNIRNLALHDLRSKIGIVPQDPVLFSGTLRSNLDPFNQYTDEQVYAALDAANLGDYVSSLENKLDHRILEFGSNLSQGQRQLICLARVLLKNPKILLLDEATSSVDGETDSLLQKTIVERFPSTTQLTIAHRLNTVMNSDRILVMEAGEAVEYDTPANLLAHSSKLHEDFDEPEAEESNPTRRRANFAELYRRYINSSK